jgi:hypothetical protein
VHITCDGAVAGGDKSAPLNEGSKKRRRKALQRVSRLMVPSCGVWCLQTQARMYIASFFGASSTSFFSSVGR